MLKLRNLLTLALILSCATAVMAKASSAGDVPAAVRAALARLAPGERPSNMNKAPMPGYYQALVHGRIVYISDDGKYVMSGQLFDAQARRNLTEDRMKVIRRELLATVPASDRLIFAPPHPKYTVTVFTDIDCPYCRIFHSQIAAYNAEGIAVQYLFWPRTGLKAVPSGRDTPSYEKAVSVWCAKDPKKAFTEAKMGREMPKASCPNPVAREYHLGERIGVDGTPTIVAEDGTVINGYLPPMQLLDALKQIQAANDASPGDASTTQR